MEDLGSFYLFNDKGKNKKIILTCEHAGYETPDGYETLGIEKDLFKMSISHDIGIKNVAITLATILDCPLFIGKYSRLVIDLNRSILHRWLIKTKTFLCEVPFNQNLDEAEILKRINEYHRPYHMAINDMMNAYKNPALLSLHSFTPHPSFLKSPRPWDICVAFSKENELSRHIIEKSFSLGDIKVGVNKPFNLLDKNKNGNGPSYQYGIKGLNAVLFEIKNNHIQDELEQERWGRTISDLLPDFIKA